MSKIGRNDPCPCGSGKKYKKCCLAQDQAKQRISPPRDETDDLFEDALPTLEDLDEDLLSAETDDSVLAEYDFEPYVGKIISDDLPEISVDDQKLVDAWWSAYRKMSDADRILQHLDSFFRSHPELVENLGLHYEVLFDLGADLVSAGRAGDYVDVLERVRQEFPSTYLKSFTYYDRDLIMYRVVERGPEGIEGLLGLFKEYPDDGPDNLFSVIDFLMITECDAALIDLVEAIYDPICRSENVISGCGELVAVVTLAYCIPSLDAGWTDADLESLSTRLRAIRPPLHDEWYRTEFLDRLLNQISGDLDDAFFASFGESTDLAGYYAAVTANFMGWLHREQGFSWMKSHFYRVQLHDYLLGIIPPGRRPKQPFTFTLPLLESALKRKHSFFFGLSPTLLSGTLNAIHWFSVYLGERGLMTDEARTDVQGWCNDIWLRETRKSAESRIEARTFERFPM
jgi:hypothetical protein